VITTTGDIESEMSTYFRDDPKVIWGAWYFSRCFDTTLWMWESSL